MTFPAIAGCGAHNLHSFEYVGVQTLSKLGLPPLTPCPSSYQSLGSNFRRLDVGA